MRQRAISDRGRAFSVVELLAVLLIIGALTSVALPRFASLTGAVYHARISATVAAFDSGIRFARLSCILASWANRDNMPGYAGGVVDFNTNCYPTDTTGNANTIGNNAARCVNVWNDILEQAPSIATTGATTDFRATAQGNRCTYVFLLDRMRTRQFVYDAVNGTLTVTNP